MIRLPPLPPRCVGLAWMSDFAGAPRQSIRSRQQRRTRSLSAARHGRAMSFRNERVVYSLPSAHGSRLISFALGHLVCALLIPRSDLNQIAPLATERIAASKPALARGAMRRSVPIGTYHATAAM
jgi:hypothetical protein